MKTRAYFDELWGDEWPTIDWLEPRFRAPPRGISPLQAKKGDGRFEVEGVDGTGHLDKNNGRIDAVMLLCADPRYGLLFDYTRFGGGVREAFLSKGDLRRRLEWVKSPHGTPLSIGLFVPVEKGWNALKQFIESKGQLPTAIEWIAEGELPPETFPLPENWKHLKIEKT